MKNRIENYLSKIAGNDDAIDIAPANRMEAALNDIAENGGGVAIVEVKQNQDESYAANMTLAEIVSAVDSGKMVFAKIIADPSAQPVAWTIANLAVYSEEVVVFSFMTTLDATTLLITAIGIDESGVSVQSSSYTLTPAT